MASWNWNPGRGWTRDETIRSNDHSWKDSFLGMLIVLALCAGPIIGIGLAISGVLDHERDRCNNRLDC